MNINKAFLEWVPVAVLGLISLLVMFVFVADDEEQKQITLSGLKVSPDLVRQGEPITLMNGVCNKTDEPLVVEVYLAAQRKVPDPVLEPDVFTLIEREQGKGEGRGRTISIDPGCTFNEPIETEVPIEFPVGEWRLFLEIVARGSSSEELQRITEFSNYFRVVPPDG